ncbi:hypothetical protein BG005_005626 [Podila minutissima]|nr:hypothetical protein BG005_005626 [Podila minutissima]
MGPSIGHMPEILDIILEYLDRSTVRYSASCVNKMWNAACRPYIHTVTKWNVFQTEETLLAHHKSVQKQVSILHVFQPDDLDTIVNAPYHGGKPHDNIKLLAATLKGLSLREQQQYTALIIHDTVMSRLTLRDIEDLFPDLNAWSCSKADANRPMFAFLKNTYHHLTTLEIISEYQLAAIPLHEYLGEAPNLVHLRAPEVFINIEDLQVHLTAQQTTRGALWACSRLETLHISIQDRFDKNSTRQHSFSRALFTYLAAVCPKLVDVYISYSTLTFEMESGFCQLSKLKNLRSLQLKTARPERVTELDLWWTSASSLSRRKLWSSPMEKLKVEATLAKMRMSKEAKAPIPFVFGGFSSEEEVLEKGLCFDQSHIDIDNVVRECHLSSTVDLLDSMLKAKENGSDIQCWPDLEIWSLIKSGQFPAPVQVDLIEKLRPGIRFKRSIYCDLAE